MDLIDIENLQAILLIHERGEEEFNTWLTSLPADEIIYALQLLKQYENNRIAVLHQLEMNG